MAARHGLIRFAQGCALDLRSILLPPLRSGRRTKVLIHACPPNCPAIWLPVVDSTPNFLERIRLFSETFPSGSNQLGQNAGANAAEHRPFLLSGFAPFASKILTLTGFAFAPINPRKQETSLFPFRLIMETGH